MLATRKISVLCAAALVAIAPLGAVSAANAATSLPIGETMYGLECDSDLATDFYSVTLDAVGALTAIGTSAVNPCWLGATFDPTTGLAYAVESDYSSKSTLYSINTADGTFTNLGNIKVGGADIYMSALAINSAGVLYGFSSEDSDEKIYTIDLTTRVATFVSNLNMDFDNYLDAAAFNPVDNELYGLNQGGGGVYKIDLTSGIGTKLSDSNYNTKMGGASFSFSFDSSGTAWFLISKGGAGNDIWSTDITAIGTTAVKVSTLTAQQNLGSIFIGSPSEASEFTVTFNANGGTGTAMPDQTAASAANLTKNSFTRNGYTFAGWSTSPTGAVEYTDGAIYPFTSSQTLYAVWKQELANTGTDDAASVPIGVGLLLAGMTLAVLTRRKRTS